MKNNSLFIILQKMRKPFLVILVTYAIAIFGLTIIDGVDSDGNVYNMSIFDAFYFISYTATTIGFGETPYTFTYPQRIWVTFCIYLTVLGWFYSIGSLITLLQDKLFISELEKAKFLRQIKNLNERFIVVLGYNQITRKIIIKAMEEGLRTVVIERDKSKINNLNLENFTPTVPVLHSETYSVKVLEAAGLKKKNCKAIVSLLEEDDLNLKITLIAKALNPNVKVAVKSTTSNHTENLKDLDAEVIVNPFSIISSEISLALWSANLFKIEKWLYGIDNLNATLPVFPKGLYIICGYGRMGKRVFEKLNEHDIEVKLIEIDKSKNIELTKDEISHLVFGNADDRELLLEVGIKKAVAIAAITDNDTTNLSILATAKKLNPNIVTIVRENDIADDFLFKKANINHIFTPSKILVNKVTNALVMPLSDKFLKLIIKKDNLWASKLVARLLKEINEKPLLVELEINENKAPQIYKYLLSKEKLSLDLLATSLYNKELKNNVVPLLLQRENDTILLPLWEEELKIGDKILLACDSHAKNDIEYICQNIYEFYYALTGKEKQTILKGFI
ncbi:potassium channel family protein [Arcobacter cloacae]|uniref:Potassium transporter TrkA n=1 Tax=Arcobacter cloacae TaxID=1054034 RepID=A0A6M8NQ34_9BACT|nr:NAD-binding protein [Arcobacter cloacae]QKF90617.1 TrkA domain-containing protein [Arcobacter cloacae]RXI37258.1 potassium transporter TrkA [Arcobacter cloacae]